MSSPPAAGRSVAEEPALRVRPARTGDVPGIKALVDQFAGAGRRMLAKELAGLYEDVQEFTVVTSLTPAALTPAALTPAALTPAALTPAALTPAASGTAPADHPETETVIGCGALHVLWGDLGEVRTLAVDPAWQGRRIGSAILARLVERGRELGLSRLFALTFHTDFFSRHGFVEIDGAPVDAAGFEALRRSYDPGVAEFLGLEFVKPNTLGNTRMLLTLAT